MYKISASVIGILIAVMLAFNGVLSGKIGSITTLPVVHIAGFLTVSLVLLLTKEKHDGKPVPLYLNAGGIIGVCLVLMNNRCFDSLGASLTLSLGILGQSIGSIIADSTGFLGLKKYPFDNRKFAGLILLSIGAFIMTDSWRGDILSIILAFTAGVFVILSMIINSQLSKRIGTFHGVRRNYLTGLISSVLVLYFTGFDSGEFMRILPDVHPVYLLGGGFLGVMIVAGSNRVLPRIPAIYTTLLIFGGQAVAGIIIDYIISGILIPRKLVGVLIIIIGLFINLLLEKSPVKTLKIS